MIEKMSNNFKCDSANYLNVNQYQMFTEVYGAEKLDTLVRLKDSSKKLIYVLEHIQSKSSARDTIPAVGPPLSSVLTPVHSENLNTATDVLSLKASAELEKQLKNIDSIELEDEDDDCSVYKKLTRKCQCLTKTQYNDFVIHFNEDTEYFTSTFGEIVKNIRILKNFLYIGGSYTNNALEFLNEGLSDNSYTNKIEIAQACAYADLCNIFDHTSIIVQCMSTNIKSISNIKSNDLTQNLTVNLLFKLATIEEGRRYLNFTSKVIHQLRKLVKKDNTSDSPTQETLKSTIDLLDQTLPQQLHAYFHKPIEKDCGVKAIESLIHYRHFMTLNEVYSQLELLRNLSYRDATKKEILKMLPILLGLFKNIIVEYDSSEINILATSILNNVILRRVINNDVNYTEIKNICVATDACTEPVTTKNGVAQVPTRKLPIKSILKKKPKSNNTTTKNSPAMNNRTGEWRNYYSCDLKLPPYKMKYV